MEISIQRSFHLSVEATFYALKLLLHELISKAALIRFLFTSGILKRVWLVLVPPLQLILVTSFV